VVVKEVPAGVTAVGNPARLIRKEVDASREAAAAKMGFSAYGVTQGDDPVSQAMKGLIDHAASQEHQVALLWQALRQLQAAPGHEGQADCVPQDAKTVEAFDAEGLSTLVK
jgi:serine O-acetyltransferase